MAVTNSEGAFQEALSLGGLILRVARHKFALALSFLVLGGVTEGLSILLLLPILATIATNDGNFAIQAPDWLSRHLPIVGGRIDLHVLLIAFVALVTVQALFNRFKTIYMSQLIYAFINHLRRSMFESIGRTTWTTFVGEKGSDLNHSLNGEIERTQVAAIYSFMLLQNIVLLLGYSILSAIVSPVMTGFAAIAGIIMLLLLRPIRRRAAEHGKTLTADAKSQFHTVSEFLAGFKIAKSLNIEETFLQRFRHSLDQMMENNRRYVRLSTIGTATFQIASAAAAAIFIYVALVQFSMRIEQIIVMIVLFMRLAPRFMEIQTNVQQLLVSLPAYASMRALKAKFDAALETAETVHAPPIRLRKEIAVHGLIHSYGGLDERSAVSDASFVIPAGRITALIGPSGSGKSTIADVLLGLLEPRGGWIAVDGRRIDAVNRRAWRKQVAYVPQDVFLLNDTIAANLRLAVPEASDDALWQALRAAQADFVRCLPLGLDTVVGDRGVRMSGGERQRIALARALLHHPQLLILDEATSSLDWENQQHIAAAIRRLRGTMTILTIAHRPSMITFADWVIALEDGRIVETGSFKKLVKKSGSRLSQLIDGERRKAKP